MAKTSKKSKPLKSKDENYWAIFEAVIRLDFQKGPMAWKISDIARASKVSRTLIYYYFGNSKEHIMQTAIEFLGEEYFGLSQARKILWKEGRLLESLLGTRELCQRAPYVHFFYMTRRDMKTPVGEKLREFEERFHKKISTHFPLSDRDQVMALAAVIFGLVASPNVNENGVKAAIEIIKKNTQFTI